MHALNFTELQKGFHKGLNSILLLLSPHSDVIIGMKTCWPWQTLHCHCMKWQNYYCSMDATSLEWKLQNWTLPQHMENWASHNNEDFWAKQLSHIIWSSEELKSSPKIVTHLVFKSPVHKTRTGLDLNWKKLEKVGPAVPVLSKLKNDQLQFLFFEQKERTAKNQFEPVSNRTTTRAV